MSSDNEASQLSSPVQYDTDTFFFSGTTSDGWTRGGAWRGEGTWGFRPALYTTYKNEA